jgi:hypothetical protein
MVALEMLPSPVGLPPEPCNLPGPAVSSLFSSIEQHFFVKMVANCFYVKLDLKME